MVQVSKFDIFTSALKVLDIGHRKFETMSVESLRHRKCETGSEAAVSSQDSGSRGDS